jgi:hypothetical protein
MLESATQFHHTESAFEYYDKYNTPYLQDVLDNNLCQVWNKTIIEEILDERGVSIEY